MAIRRWIPPAVIENLGSVLPDRFQRFEVVESWDDAERRCIGYEQSTLNDLSSKQVSSAAKIQHPTSRDLQFIAAAGICLEASQPRSHVRVLDFGGGNAHYFHIATAMFPDVSWEWLVVETPAMVGLATEANNDPAISWTSDLDSVLGERWDFVLASASLNYVSDPTGVLDRLRRSAPHMLLTRLPLWPIDRHLPAIQRLSRGSRTGAYPTWFFSEAVLLAQIATFGDIIARFEVPEDTALVAGHRRNYSGLLIRTRDAS